MVEAIVGDIEDEHDETETPVQAAGNGAFIVEARATLDEVSEAVGFDFASLGDAEEVDTIGGLVTASAGRFRAGARFQRAGGLRIRDSRRRSAPDQAPETLVDRVPAIGFVAGRGAGEA